MADDERKPIVEKHKTFTFIDRRGVATQESQILKWEKEIRDKYTPEELHEQAKTLINEAESNYW